MIMTGAASLAVAAMTVSAVWAEADTAKKFPEATWQGKPPVIEKFTLWEADQGGYGRYRIPGIVITKKGTVLAFCDARKTPALGDWSSIDICMRRSTDEGRTWGPSETVVHLGLHAAQGFKFERNPVAVAQGLGGDDQRPITNQLPIVDQVTGQIHLLHCVEQARCFYMVSNDDGVTWSPPVEITSTFDEFRPEYDWKVLATGPAHGIQITSTGRLVVPVWLARGTGGNAHRPSIVSTIYSDDHGKTWHRGDIVANETDPLINPNETIALELADGQVMMNIRSETPTVRRRAVAFSPDGATKWTRPAFDQALLEPICMGSLIRLSSEKTNGKNRILFSNPHNDLAEDKAQIIAKRAIPRRNLSIKLSYDEGKTWAIDKVLEPGPSGYSDMAVMPDGTVLCIYEDGLSKADTKWPDARITLARFNLEWLSDGKDTLKK